MSYQLRPASRSQAKPLIGLYSESGCGKTWSALMLARGFVGNGAIAMIETESGRGEAYADLLPGGYSVCSMRDDFSPEQYGQALTAVEASNPAALIIDSASHEWEGAGGVLSMAADNQAAGKKGPLVWQKPKMDHARHFMLRLLATPIPLVIVCMRAKYPMKETIVNGRKDWTRSEELVPKQSEDILFELFVHGWIDREHRFHGSKYTRDDLRQALVSGEPISYETGKRLAAWAAGGMSRPATPTATATTTTPDLATAIRSVLAAATKDGIPAEAVNAYVSRMGMGDTLKTCNLDQLRVVREAIKSGAIVAPDPERDPFEEIGSDGSGPFDPNSDVPSDLGSDLGF